MFATRFVWISMAILGGLLVTSASSVRAADGDATGLITLNGKPLAAGKITFHRDNGQFLGSKVKDGNYTIDRVPTGTLRVTIDGPGVPLKFASEETSGLIVKAEEANNRFDFVLR